MPRLKYVKNTLIYYAILGAVTLIRAMSRRQAISFMQVMGSLGFYLAAGERKRAIHHLRRAYGDELSSQEIEDLAKRVFRNLGAVGADAIRLPCMSEEEIEALVTARGMDHLDRALAGGKGFVLQTGHYGNWELLGTWLVNRNYPLRVVAKPLYDPRVDKLVVDYRNRAGYANTARGNAVKEVVKGIMEGYAYGLLFDIDTDVKGTFVNFFGRPAYTPTIPVILARQLEVPIVPVFIRLKKDFTYEVNCLEPIPLVSTEDEKADVITNTQLCSDVYEAQIRKHPDQWIWMHRRWKTKPSHIRQAAQ